MEEFTFDFSGIDATFVAVLVLVGLAVAILLWNLVREDRKL